jgi:hypothetical protein
MTSGLRSRITVRLRSIQRRLVSKADALGALDKLEHYEVVVLDFAGIEDCGNAFLDQVFRTWVTDHPSSHIQPTNMSAGVRLSVERITARRK